MVDVEWSRVRWFTPAEFVSRRVVAELVYRLDAAREIAGVPFVLTSTWRPGDVGAHPKGTGADIRCSGSSARFRIVSALIEAGFTRIGIYDRHIHVDVDESAPELVMWIGFSS